ncbi:methyltransferase domain-containing protein [Pseudotabrizicola sediminis]|uniref:Methyltransferase domain-containing protein n=1 Tax=Pseudotabrizicola sediminis TaxID=2486418 RepID=A0ABY2KKR7_9RHOB|nr:methyltransferase domain-containing protein [Pseudotabrizicola sediminis]
MRRPGPGWLVRAAMSPRFHAVIERIPGLRLKSRAEGRALFDVVSGFVQSQALLALVELRVLNRLADGPLSTSALALGADVPPERMAILLQSGAALKLLRHARGLWHLTPRGGAFLTVPGLEAMVRHHDVLYRDLSDPVAFFRGQTQPELARFWPYVFGAGGAADPALAARYSRLMTDSQGLVAADTLRLVSLGGTNHLMDVGGGTGAFLRAVAAEYPGLRLTLFDLPAVVAGAAPLPNLTVHAGSFRDDPLPEGADMISLIRVLYDHTDATVAALLASALRALPPGGRLLISEPMSGGAVPDPATDVYFAIYTLAMQTGRTRSAAEIAALLAAAGFTAIRPLPGPRPYVTSAITAQKPAG